MAITLKRSAAGTHQGQVRDGGGIIHKATVKKAARKSPGAYELRVGTVDKRYFPNIKTAVEYLNQFYTVPRESDL